jgi:hypothetical protein
MKWLPCFLIMIINSKFSIFQVCDANKMRFCVKPFKYLILGMNSQSMSIQKLAFENILLDWLGKQQQVDDISLVGVKV